MKRLTISGACQSLGRRVGELRVERGLTQEQLAERLGVSPRWVQPVEGGRENLTVGTVVGLANALKAPLASFFEPPTAPKPKAGRPRRSA